MERFDPRSMFSDRRSFDGPALFLEDFQNGFTVSSGFKLQCLSFSLEAERNKENEGKHCGLTFRLEFLAPHFEIPTFF